jgi:glucoamylase
MELGTVAPSSDLDAWIAEQTQHSTAAMELAISATTLARRRAEFGQNIVPARGSVLASVAIGDWNPEPDYFFHWIRDSAIVMRTVTDLMARAVGGERARWQTHFLDYGAFSLSLTRDTPYDHDYREKTREDRRKFLREEHELAALKGDARLGEPRFNPDGSTDVMQWSRPQFDGPALRALACLRFLEAGGPATGAISTLLAIDLDFTMRHAGQRCVGPWEEKAAHHYYVALVQLGALVRGQRRTQIAAPLQAAERKLRSALELHWSEQRQIYTAVERDDAGSAADSLDAAFLLAVLDADLAEGPHSAIDPRVHRTQHAIEALFAEEFSLNRSRFAGRAPALGRYRADRYFGGGAWYPTTLANAALYYRRACLASADRAMLIRRGDDVMATVRDLTPADGTLSEQVDRTTGQQTSARHLTWSYAAFIDAARLRAQALRCA